MKADLLKFSTVALAIFFVWFLLPEKDLSSSLKIEDTRQLVNIAGRAVVKNFRYGNSTVVAEFKNLKDERGVKRIQITMLASDTNEVVEIKGVRYQLFPYE